MRNTSGASVFVKGSGFNQSIKLEMTDARVLFALSIWIERGANGTFKTQRQHKKWSKYPTSAHRNALKMITNKKMFHFWNI